ncbi:ribonuclease H-like domain, reverse transcriptase, RNA-dependent DNA polymerase [Tanacetum coccineum]
MQCTMSFTVRLQKVWRLVDLPKGKHAIGTKWVYRNKKDEKGIVVRNKARLVTQGYTQEEGIDYNKVFDPVAWIEAIRRGTIDKTLFIKKDIGFRIKQKDDGIFISQDKYVADILKKFDFVIIKTASTPIETNKALLKDEEAEDVDVHLYRSMIGSLMYLTASRPDIMFAVCACARDSPFDLEAFSDSDYAGASLDRKSTTGGCQFLGKRLISWQCKKQTIVANSTTKAEYVVAANFYGQFVDQRNMVACLERIDGNADFHEIVDFLTTSPIHYALTTIVISESSVRSDLHFNDEDGITCLTNETIFENLALMGYESDSDKLTFEKALFSPQWKQALQEDTQLPQTSVPIPNVADEAVFKEWDDRVVRATTTAASLDAAQASGNITKTQSTAMSNDPLSQEIGSGDRPRCQEAMGGVIAQTRSERASKHSYDSPLPGVNTPGSDEERIEHQELTDNIPPTPHDSPLSGGYTPGSDEGRPDLHELMAICTKLSDRVLDLEKEKDAQAVEILKLKNRIKKLERKAKSSIPPPKRRLYKQVDSSDDSLGEENASKQLILFVDQHNMVACLERTEGNADFHQIVDFLNASTISSKSTAWNEFSTNIASAVICLANNQKFNFSKLIFDEPFNDTYETPKHNQKVFANMRRKGKGFSGKVTLLFQSMLAIQAVEGEGSRQPSEPQPTPSPASPSHEV